MGWHHLFLDQNYWKVFLPFGGKSRSSWQVLPAIGSDTWLHTYVYCLCGMEYGSAVPLKSIKNDDSIETLEEEVYCYVECDSLISD